MEIIANSAAIDTSEDNRFQGHNSAIISKQGATLPPAAVRTLNDLMYWQYAKIIAESAKMGKRQWPFIMDRFKKLQSGEIAWDSIREYVKEREDTRRCIYCEKSADLTMDHLIPSRVASFAQP